MSVDDRLRAGLHANAEAIDPSVENHLDAVRRRGRRRRILHFPGVGPLAATAVTTLLVSVAGITAARLHNTSPPVPMATPSATGELFGRYRAVVTSPARLAGTWTIALDGNGVAIVTRPRGYTGVVSGTLFSATESTIRITLFSQDVCEDFPDGEYAWRRQADRLVLTAASEQCAARRSFFAANEWTLAP